MDLKNDRLLRALLRQPVDRTPVWIMRQAGRYLPEYLATRAQAGNFMNLCQTPELACEVTLQPLRRYDLDAAIIFSDILTIPDAMGLGLYFETGEGPKFERPVGTRADIEALPRPDIGTSLRYVTDAVSLTRREIDGKVPLLGFSGSPWTLATYMVEGGSSKTFSKAKKLLYQEPATAHLLLDKLADTIIDYLNAQIEAGAQGVQIFDTWGGALSFDAYREFSLQYMEKIVAGLKREHAGRRVPVILFSKGCNTQLEALAGTGCDALGVDWTITLDEARRRVGDRVALQGNLDPSILLSNPSVIRREVRRTLESFGPGEGHVFNLGHGITPDVNPDHLAALIDEVRSFSPSLHRG
jgi:uroporphyrinogen decarboxylase